MEFIHLLLSSFWHFVGLTIFTSMFLVSVVNVVKYLISLLTITFRGYPPEHCDAVGAAHPVTTNSKKQEVIEENDNINTDNQ